MRKFLFLILLLLPTIASARVNGPKYICGKVLFTDGHEESFRYVELPERNSKTLTVGEKGTKNLRTIPAEEIVSLTVWHVDHPEKANTIYQLDYQSIHSKVKKVYHIWGLPIMASDWGVVFRASTLYRIEDKTGDFYTVTVKQNGGGDDAMIIKCRDFKYAQWGGIIWGKNDPENGQYPQMVWQANPRKMAKIFASNPKIAQQVCNQELVAKDMQYIIDQMAIMSEEEAQQLNEEEPTKGRATVQTFTQQVRLEYINYFSNINQNLNLAWEYDFNCFFIGFQAGVLGQQFEMIDLDSYDYIHNQYHYTRDTINRYTPSAGVRIGLQMPVHIGKKWTAVPRLMVAPSFAPFTFLHRMESKGTYLDLPLSLGSDFCYPIKQGVYLHGGIHYVYNLSVHDNILHPFESKNRVMLTNPDENIDQMSVIGQSGLMVSLSINW